MSDLTDPDWLSFLLCGMHEHNQASYPRPYTPAEQLNQLNEDGLLERSAPVLDSLARLLIRNPGDQPVSVTVVPPNPIGAPSHRRTTVLVSQNAGVPAAVSKQLEIIIEYLSAARKLYLSERVDKRTIELTSPSEESPTDTPLQRELMELERALHRYCWAKEKRRLIKDGRHSLFKELVLNVYGVPADSRPELAEEVAEREALNVLQNITPDEKELLGETACLIADLTSLLSGDPPPPPTSSDDPQGNKVVAPLLPVMHRLDTLASDRALQTLWSLCDDYLAKLLDRKRREATEAAAPREPDAPKQKIEKIAAAFGVQRWLQKITSVTRDHFLLATAITSARMAPLLDTSPTVRPIHATATQQKHVVSENHVEDTLVLAGEAKADEVHQLAKTFVEWMKTRRNGQKLPSEIESWTERSANVIHCECVLLTELQKLASEGRPIIAYIGVSKLSCALCHLYFECCRRITGTVITTLGTHGQLTNWGTPTLLCSEDDRRVKEALCRELKAKLRVEVRHAKARQSSFQSTVGSHAGVIKGSGTIKKYHLEEVIGRLTQ